MSTGPRTRLRGGLFTRFRTGQDEITVCWVRIGFTVKDYQSTSSSVTNCEMADEYKEHLDHRGCGPEEIKNYGGMNRNTTFASQQRAILLHRYAQHHYYGQAVSHHQSNSSIFQYPQRSSTDIVEYPVQSNGAISYPSDTTTGPRDPMRSYATYIWDLIFNDYGSDVNRLIMHLPTCP